MAETIIFKARPRAVVHNGKLTPMRFDTRGIYKTNDHKEIEILRGRHYVEEVGVEGEEDTGGDDAGEPKAPKQESEAKRKKREALEAQEKERLEKEAANKGAAGDDAGEKRMHTLTKEDFENNPALAETYKVGDVVDISAL